MRGSSSGLSGWSEYIHDTIRPRPLAAAVSQSNEPQAPHIGAGGWRSTPQSAQRWISKRPSAAPSQKKASSGADRRVSLIR
jgi:hypothetical protein